MQDKTFFMLGSLLIVLLSLVILTNLPLNLAGYASHPVSAEKKLTDSQSRALQNFCRDLTGQSGGIASNVNAGVSGDAGSTTGGMQSTGNSAMIGSQQPTIQLSDGQILLLKDLCNDVMQQLHQTQISQPGSGDMSAIPTPDASVPTSTMPIPTDIVSITGAPSPITTPPVTSPSMMSSVPASAGGMIPVTPQVSQTETTIQTSDLVVEVAAFLNEQGQKITTAQAGKDKIIIGIAFKNKGKAKIEPPATDQDISFTTAFISIKDQPSLLKFPVHIPLRSGVEAEQMVITQTEDGIAKDASGNPVLFPEAGKYCLEVHADTNSKIREGEGEQNNFFAMQDQDCAIVS